LGAGTENSTFVRIWIIRSWPIMPSALGPGAGRRSTPGGMIIFLGSGPDVCWISAFAGSLFTGIRSGGNIVPIPI
jgi:hypothetical protein